MAITIDKLLSKPLMHSHIAGDISGLPTQYTDEMAQDAIGAMIGNSLAYTDATPLLDTIQDIRTSAGPTFDHLHITNSLIVDTSTLAVNVSEYENRVGVGTAIPRTTFEVMGDNCPFILQKTASTGFSVSAYYPSLNMNMWNNGVQWLGIGTGYTGMWYINPTTGLMSFGISTASVTAEQELGTSPVTDRLVITKDGDVGIGVSAPAATLHVRGAYIRMNNSAATRYRSDWAVSSAGTTSLNSYDDTGKVYMPYVINAGGVSIVSPSAAFTGLIVKGAASQSANLQEWQNSSGTVMLSVDDDGDLNFPAGTDIDLATTTGTKIGTATNQLLGFFNAAPVVQQTGVATQKVNYTTGDLDSEAEIITALNTTNAAINTLRTALNNLGLTSTV